ncbi:MAG: 2-amino-4-hydroxy-6-hydroxymethyldihydropteridine diphosphokinase [Nitrospinae bacterium CG11_big_fil_rev_8_21_14_0_20_45_15]|nr:MAG: 2-amino-4-hydroxy-6-hydroxymethyldihydropteridine diphosphokinase [Nitrospinae bacterium CG11_big_fil_rev_8_21_14_0_20_45_15]
MSITAFIGIGSNLGSAKKNCEQAIEHLQNTKCIRLLATSSFYTTAPIGVTEQNWFVNAVVKISTTYNPQELLDNLLSIEKEMGRKARKKWGPREIDLDILFYDQQILSTDSLKIPHPELSHRRFVLEPLNELAPDWNHPQLNKTSGQLLAELPPGQEVNRYSD